MTSMFSNLMRSSGYENPYQDIDPSKTNMEEEAMQMLESEYSNDSSIGWDFLDIISGIGYTTANLLNAWTKWQYDDPTASKELGEAGTSLLKTFVGVPLKMVGLGGATKWLTGLDVAFTDSERDSVSNILGYISDQSGTADWFRDAFQKGTWGNFALGLGLDIATDPTTYFSAGGGALAKNVVVGAGKAAVRKSLTMAGTKLANEIAEKAAPKLLERLGVETGEELSKKLGSYYLPKVRKEFAEVFGTQADFVVDQMKRVDPKAFGDPKTLRRFMDNALKQNFAGIFGDATEGLVKGSMEGAQKTLDELVKKGFVDPNTASEVLKKGLISDVGIGFGFPFTDPVALVKQSTIDGMGRIGKISQSMISAPGLILPAYLVSGATGYMGLNRALTKMFVYLDPIKAGNTEFGRSVIKAGEEAEQQTLVAMEGVRRAMTAGLDDETLKKMTSAFEMEGAKGIDDLLGNKIPDGLKTFMDNPMFTNADGIAPRTAGELWENISDLMFQNYVMDTFDIGTFMESGSQAVSRLGDKAIQVLDDGKVPFTKEGLEKFINMQFTRSARTGDIAHIHVLQERVKEATATVMEKLKKDGVDLGVSVDEFLVGREGLTRKAASLRERAKSIADKARDSTDVKEIDALMKKADDLFTKANDIDRVGVFGGKVLSNDTLKVIEDYGLDAYKDIYDAAEAGKDAIKRTGISNFSGKTFASQELRNMAFDDISEMTETLSGLSLKKLRNLTFENSEEYLRYSNAFTDKEAREVFYAAKSLAGKMKAGKLEKGKALADAVTAKIREVSRNGGYVPHKVENLSDYQQAVIGNFSDVEKQRNALAFLSKLKNGDKETKKAFKTLNKSLNEFKQKHIDLVGNMTDDEIEVIKKIGNKEKIRDLFGPRARETRSPFKSREFTTLKAGKEFGIEYQMNFDALMSEQIGAYAKWRKGNTMLRLVEENVEVPASKIGYKNFFKVREKGTSLFDMDLDSYGLPDGLRLYLEQAIKVKPVKSELLNKARVITNQFIKPMLTIFRPAFFIRNRISGWMGMGTMDSGVNNFGYVLQNVTKALWHITAGNMEPILATKKLGMKTVWSEKIPFLGTVFAPSRAISAAFGEATSGLLSESADKFLKSVDDKTGRYWRDLVQDFMERGGMEAGVSKEIDVIKNRGAISNLYGATSDFLSRVSSRDEAIMRFNHYHAGVAAGRSTDEAFEYAQKYYIDYTPRTDAEQMIRTFIPFYKFAKEVATNYVPELMKRPMLAKTILAPYRESDSKDLLPSWMEDTVHFNVGKDADGNPLYVTGFGLPIESLTGYFSSGGFGATLSKLVGSMNPLIKTPIEAITGKNFFFDSSWKDYTKPFNFMLNSDYIRENIMVTSGLVRKSVSKSGKVYYSMDARLRFFLSSLPISPLISSLDNLGDTRHKFWQNLAQSISGFKITSVGPRQREQAIEQALARAFESAKMDGAVGQFKQYYLSDYNQKERYQGLFNVQKWLKEKKRERKKTEGK